VLGVQAQRGLPSAALALLVACSATPAGSHGGSGGNGTAGSAGKGSGSSAARVSGTSGTGFANAPTNPNGVRTDGGLTHVPTADCVGETQKATMVDVDMYIMLDRSGSMLEPTGAGPTKWDAIRQALTSFLQDPQSSGLGVGLQYFPLGTSSVPDMCTTDAECGNAGPCTNKACLPPRLAQSFPFTQCLTAADCPLASPGCATFGQCEADNTLACFNLGANGCQQQGACTVVAGGCIGYASCIQADYASPAVPIDVLPANAPALVSSLMAEKALGLTPTPAALAGAIDRAAARAQQNPSHRVIVVLATDGMPTDCVPQGTTTVTQAVTVVANLAANGLAMSPSIESYVIGIFTANDTGAMSNLDRMAMAGGTGKAFVVDTGLDVKQQFLDTLATIRGGTLDCEFQLPAPPPGANLDFKLVNVELTQAGGTDMLLYVQSPDRCNQAKLGWYYDADPAQGQTPTKINVCPQTCDTLRAAHDATVDVRLGCATIGPL
jgi:hypothetical protein